VLEVLKSRDKPAVLAWLKAGKESGLLAALREVTIDMWGGFEAAAWEVFGHDVRVTIDRLPRHEAIPGAAGRRAAGDPAERCPRTRPRS